MKKLLSLLLVFVTILALFAGCGKASENYTSTNVLSNPNATVEAKKLYDYICSISGEKCLSAQQESTWMGSADYEINYIYDVTEKYPAIRGLDYMSDDFKGVNKRAIKWWNEGGIVTILWHTGADFSGEWSHCMNTIVL